MKRDGKKNIFGRQWEVERHWEAMSRVWLRIQSPFHPLGPVIIRLSNLCIPVQEQISLLVLWDSLFNIFPRCNSFFVSLYILMYHVPNEVRKYTSSLLSLTFSKSPLSLLISLSLGSLVNPSSLFSLFLINHTSYSYYSYILSWYQSNKALEPFIYFRKTNLCFFSRCSSPRSYL